MNPPLTYRNVRYYHYSYLVGPEAKKIYADTQSRQSFVSSAQLKLDRTCGVYLPVGGQSLLFIIDIRTIKFDSDEWRLIARIAEHLVKCWPQLDADAKTALKALYAVTFTTSPNRAYADVKPKTFVYDVDEFRDSAGGLITVAYAVSNIIHDANHIHQYDMHQAYDGAAAEQICWKLQIANAAALGLAPYEVDFLTKLVEKPELVAARLASDPFGSAAKLACSVQGKCTVNDNG